MMGNFSVVMSLAPAAGPVVGGLIISYLPWHYIFILVLPIALIALTLGMRRMVNVTEPHKASLDILSVILSAFAFGGLVYGLSGLGSLDAEAGSQSVAWIALGVGVVTMALFIWRQISLQSKGSPLLDLRTFLSWNNTEANNKNENDKASMFGSLNLLPYYLQNVLKLEPG